jgi:hypothetical protein
MAELPINAVIEIKGGASYQVRLECIPRAGEFIHLDSLLEVADRRSETSFNLEVIQILHEITDVTDKVTNGQKGRHSVRVYAKKSDAAEGLFRK